MTRSPDDATRERRVLIVNSTPDIVDMLRFTFEGAGWKAATAHVHDAKDGTVDLVRLADEHGATVVVYDVAPPYEENWRFLQTIREAPSMQARFFVITTTNTRQLEKICGDCDAIEIIGKPYDLAEVLGRATSVLAV
jgi:DNA-binding response OmpR family regulator